MVLPLRDVMVRDHTRHGFPPPNFDEAEIGGLTEEATPTASPRVGEERPADQNRSTRLRGPAATLDTARKMRED